MKGWTPLRTGAALLLAALTVAVPLLAVSSSPHAGANATAARMTQEPGTTVFTASVGGPQDTLTLSTTASPGAICAFGAGDCPAQAGEARVTLSAVAGAQPTATWPDVQVAFVVETTAYDGVYWHYFGYPGKDKCALASGGQGLPCEESNAVPMFMDHAQQIAEEVSQANPHSKVSFAMVDFFATDGGDWDDGLFDGSKYHVDIPQFIPAADFGAAVTSSLKDGVFGGSYYGIVGLDDNFLHSPSITALYGALIGSGLDWSPNTHHVIVLVGSTAPRDPTYVENYDVSPFDLCCAGSQPDGWTCEPSYAFGFAEMPNCEGWVRSQDGNPTHSIAGLSRTSPTCTDSVGGRCTIDVIDLWTTPTDPYSPGWPSGVSGGGPGGSIVQMDVAHIIQAGCDLAAATGGTWDGPAYDSCPDGTAGDLQYVPHGAYNHPNTFNPTLLHALGRIGFGPVYQTLVANGTSKPMFTYAPIGSIQVAPDPQFAATCTRYNGSFLSTCQRTPTVSNVAGESVLAWNFSTVPALNQLHTGDTWSASFNVLATGPPYAQVPVDACTTVACRAAGSGAYYGIFTSADYVPELSTVPIVQSFPVATVRVEVSPTSGAVSAPAPGPPPAPPVIPIPIAPTVPVLVAFPTPATVGVASISLQAIAAGALAAGFLRVSLKNRPIALRVAAMSGAPRSRFEKSVAEESRSQHFGRFE